MDICCLYPAATSRYPASYRSLSTYLVLCHTTPTMMPTSLCCQSSRARQGTFAHREEDVGRLFYSSVLSIDLSSQIPSPIAQRPSPGHPDTLPSHPQALPTRHHCPLSSPSPPTKSHHASSIWPRQQRPPRFPGSATWRHRRPTSLPFLPTLVIGRKNERDFGTHNPSMVSTPKLQTPLLSMRDLFFCALFFSGKGDLPLLSPGFSTSQYKSSAPPFQLLRCGPILKSFSSTGG